MLKMTRKRLPILADDPEYSDLKDQMRTQLFAWMIETRDLGLIDETEMIVRADCGCEL